jgi:hypothetical protein
MSAVSQMDLPIVVMSEGVESRDSCGLSRNEHDARGPRELGVGLQHFDREGDLVANPLTGTVTVAEEFQIRDVVVAPIAVCQVGMEA